MWGKIADYLDHALQMLLRAQEQYNEGIDGIGLTVLVRNPYPQPSSPLTAFVAHAIWYCRVASHPAKTYIQHISNR